MPHLRLLAAVTVLSVVASACGGPARPSAAASWDLGAQARPAVGDVDATEAPGDAAAVTDVPRIFSTDASATGMDSAGCGQVGFNCCARGTCNGDLACVAGYCATNAGVGSGGPPGPDGAIGCGNMGFVCCNGSDCNPGLMCAAGYCTEADSGRGGRNDGGRDDGGSMPPQDVSVPNCGMMDHPCCAGGTCAAGFACDTGYCRP